MFVSEVSQYITNNTLAFGVALIVHMQSTAWPGFVFSSCSTWLERIIPSAPESSNWQSRKKKKRYSKKNKTNKKCHRKKEVIY